MDHSFAAAPLVAPDHAWTEVAPVFDFSGHDDHACMPGARGCVNLARSATTACRHVLVHHVQLVNVIISPVIRWCEYHDVRWRAWWDVVYIPMTSVSNLG